MSRPQGRRWVELRRGERRLLVMSVVVFVLLAADVLSGGLMTHLDDGIRNQLLAQGLTAPGAFSPLGDLGDTAVGIAVVAAAAAISSQLRWQIWPAVFALGALASTQALIFITKAIVARPGPGIWADRVNYPGYYPSGHTTTAMVVVGIIAYLILIGSNGPPYRENAALVALVAGWIAGTAAGLYAVLGDFHWVSDVLGGLALGTFVLVLSCAAARTYVDTAKSVEHSQ